MRKSETALSLITSVKSDTTITARMRYDVVGAIRSVVRHETGRDDDAALDAFCLDDPEALNEILGRLPSTMAGLTESSSKATISRFRSALVRAGLFEKNGRGHKPPNGPLARILDQHLHEHRAEVLPFFHWLSEQDVRGPITQNHLDDFAVNQLDRLAPKAAVQRLRALTDILNAAKLPGSPQPFVHPVPRKDRNLLKFDAADYTPDFVRTVQDAARCLWSLKLPYRLPSASRQEEIEAAIWRLAGAVCRSQNKKPQDVQDLKHIVEKTCATAAVVLIAGRHDPTESREAFSAYETARLFCLLAEHVTCADAATIEALQKLRRKNAPERQRNLDGGRQSVLELCCEPHNAATILALPARIFARMDTSEPPTTRELMSALALELGVRAGLLPYMAAGCVVGCRSEMAADDAACVLNTDMMEIHVPHSAKSQDRTIALGDGTAQIVRVYLGRVPQVGPSTPGSTQLFPGRSGGSMVPAVLSRNVADLVTPVLDTRVTAGMLPQIAAAIIMRSGGSRDTARLLLGRGYRAVDPLLDAIEGFIAMGRADGVLSGGRNVHGR
jgi:hypothetical protein